MKKKTLLDLGLIVAICLCTAAGLWLRLADLGVNNFQNDEFFHVEAAVGYLKTGEYVLWDFVSEEAGLPYERSWIYTWQVAQSFRFFGVSEFAGRLPSVVWGGLLLPLMGWLAWRTTQSRLVSLFSVILGTFDQALIWASRTCRMYSLFVFLVVLSVTLVVESLRLKRQPYPARVWWLGVAAVVAGLAYMTHESGLALGAGVLGVVTWLTLIHHLRESPEKKYWWWTLFIGWSLLLLLLGLNFIFPILPNQFFTLRNNPNWEYGLYIFNQMRMPFLGWSLLGVAIWGALRIKKDGLVVLLGTVLPILFFFIFIGNRYPEKKYFLFMLPLVLIALGYGIERAVWLGLPTLVGKLPRWIMTSVVVVVFCLVGFVPSWPGVGKHYGFQRARADDRPKNSQLHDFKTAYGKVENLVTPESNYILIQGYQSFYWTRKDLNFVSLKSNKQLTLAEFMQLYTSQPHGIVVWPKHKSYHLKTSIRSFIQKNFKRVKGTKRTHMEVYQW